MQTWYNAFKCFLVNFIKRLSVRKRNMELLHETVTYIAIKERLTYIITIETVMCIMHCRKYHLHNCTETPICIITIKIVIHIFVAEIVICIYAAETYNCTMATETVTCIIATERCTHIPVTERSTDIPVIEGTTSKPA